MRFDLGSAWSSCISLLKVASGSPSAIGRELLLAGYARPTVAV
jgi:hypothetical protein